MAVENGERQGTLTVTVSLTGAVNNASTRPGTAVRTVLPPGMKQVRRKEGGRKRKFTRDIKSLTFLSGFFALCCSFWWDTRQSLTSHGKWRIALSICGSHQGRPHFLQNRLWKVQRTCTLLLSEGCLELNGIVFVWDKGWLFFVSGIVALYERYMGVRCKRIGERK